MSKTYLITKRDGRKEELDLDKLHKVVFHACDGITGVSPSEVEIKSHIQFYNGITSSDIQETLIKSAADLISEETPNYQYVAGRLINYHLRKHVYGEFQPPSLFDIIKSNINKGFYDKEILELYTVEEINELDAYIKHDRDNLLTYAAM
jgi:ribonucleoside-diphosphate reductase alpha chain